MDAADLAPDSDSLRDTAEYLHDILLALQKRLTGSKTSKVPKSLPVLVAANKSDLFTALPPSLVKTSLEKEISRIRTSRAKGLLDSGIGMSEASTDSEKDWLGDTGEGEFEFSQMAEMNVDIEFTAGSVAGSGEPEAASYWNWLGSNL